MALYINGIGSISAQAGFANVLEGNTTSASGNRLACQEPSYAQFIDPRMSRRMSRIVKMGIASAMMALQNAQLEQPQGVIAGTGLGCLEDTISFLKKLVENNEEMLSPTAFIHSTHNTIASQVAYMLKCRGYNNTFVHRNISFESALIDAITLLPEYPEATFLVGGVDELTDVSFDILSRFGIYKPADLVSTDTLYTTGTAGTIAGEGATFFACAATPSAASVAKVEAVKTISFSSPAHAAAQLKKMLAAAGVSSVDVMISGHNGDADNDQACDQFIRESGYTGEVIKFKHLSGEYPTASAFALGLAATMLKEQTTANPHSSILIYNRYQQAHQSLMLVRSV